MGSADRARRERTGVEEPACKRIGASLEVHLRCDVIMGLFGFTEHVQSAGACHIHLTEVVVLDHFILQSHELQRVRLHLGQLLPLGLLLAELSGLGKTLLVDFGDEWVPLPLGLAETPGCSLLLFVLGCLVLERVLVQHFVLALTSVQSVRVAMVILELVEDDSLVVVSTNDLVLDVDLVDLALVDQPVVLVIADLALLASLELLPGLLLNHGRVCVQVLPLKSYFFQLLGQTSLFFTFLFLLGLNLAVHFKKTLFFGSLRPRSQQVLVVLLLPPTSIVLSLASHACLLNLAGIIHEFGRFLLLLGHVGLPLEFNLLELLALVEFEALAKLRDGHFLHEAMATSLSRVKTFGALNRDFFQLSDLPDQLSLFRQLGSFFVLALFECFLKVAMDLIPDGLVVRLLQYNLLGGSLLVGVDLCNDVLLCGHHFLEVCLALIHHDVHLVAHLVDQVVVFFFLALAGCDSLFPGHLHLNLLLLDVLEAFNLVLFTHFCLPAVELGSVFQAHGHLVDTRLRLAFLLVNQMLLALQSGHVELDLGFVLFKVGHGARLVALELEFANDRFLHLFLDLLRLEDSWAGFRCQHESFLAVSFVLVANGVDRGLPPLLLIRLDVSQRLLVHVLGCGPGLDLSFDLLGRRDHLRFGLGKVEGLELSFFRLFLFFPAVGEKVTLARVVHTPGHVRLAHATWLRLLERRDRQGRCDPACCPLFHRLDDVRHCRQVPLHAANDLFVNVREVVKGHPVLAEVLPEVVGVEGELHEDVHLLRLLADHQLPVVGRRKLVQTEEAQVGEDLVERGVIAVRAAAVPLEENPGENLHVTANKVRSLRK